ncbi:MAG: DnaJ domain-containing protein [Clostridia bacterium]|nr:DnaJ domain-containing protein [Clostridia bacterium]
MLFKDYYKILGFETNKVSIDEIKIAYREQAKKYHPDLNKEAASAEERFKDINEAYRILSNLGSKRKYDRKWNVNIGKTKNKEQNAKNMKTGDTFFAEAINMFFGAKKQEKTGESKVKNKRVQIKGDNIETSIGITIEEAFFGTSKKISLRAVDRKHENLYSKSSSRN